MPPPSVGEEEVLPPIVCFFQLHKNWTRRQKENSLAQLSAIQPCCKLPAPSVLCVCVFSLWGVLCVVFGVFVVFG